jgi:DNA end-binding protein Ku
MVGRPFWSGQLKISLVSLGVQLFPAINSQAGISFHQIDRSTGQRVRHLNVVNEDQPVENSEIVKGYEVSKGKYLTIEPDEIAKLRIETKRVIEIRQFVDRGDLPPAIFEKPYFVVPDPKQSPEAFAVIRSALEQSGKAALGEVTFSGREHLVAIAEPPEKSLRGMMAYMLRYEEELRKAEDYFSEIGKVEIDKKQLAMARELIQSYSSPFKLDAFQDDYEAALRSLIEAKQKNMPLPLEEEAPHRPKAIGLMDALRESLQRAKQPEGRKPPARADGARKKGPVLVKPPRRKRTAA